MEYSQRAPKRAAQQMADVAGEIADLYTDLGELEKAAEYYDRCIELMRKADDSSEEGLY